MATTFTSDTPSTPHPQPERPSALVKPTKPAKSAKSEKTKPMQPAKLDPQRVDQAPESISVAPNQRPSDSLREQFKIGPYRLLQTLGEGEFGKVKLGIHTESGQEFAVKLIKKESMSHSASQLGKVQREIHALQTLRHPNIIKLFDVIENDKYICIILEYASGGELFEYILAHRFLKEKDAQRMFAQLVSSVYYMHQKQVVHRDLKLENLLLDQSRNILVSDFGFANQFSTKRDLMATSCGSPCYAAPELVMNEGLYAGTAVDIWSCGVILYAMLCGYLPFDDDPGNPDGNNIGLLYQYILTTTPVFPSHVSDEAKHLLSQMLVPDPRKRCTLEHVMKHAWLQSHSDLFAQTVETMEREATEMMEQIFAPSHWQPRILPPHLLPSKQNNRDTKQVLRRLAPGSPTVGSSRRETIHGVPSSFRRFSHGRVSVLQRNKTTNERERTTNHLRHSVGPPSKHHRRDRLLGFISKKPTMESSSVHPYLTSTPTIPEASVVSKGSSTSSTPSVNPQKPPEEQQTETAAMETKLPPSKLHTKFLTSLRARLREPAPAKQEPPSPIPKKTSRSIDLLTLAQKKKTPVGGQREQTPDAANCASQGAQHPSSEPSAAGAATVSANTTAFRGWRAMKRNAKPLPSKQTQETSRRSIAPDPVSPTSTDLEKNITAQKMVQWIKRKALVKEEAPLTPSGAKAEPSVQQQQQQQQQEQQPVQRPTRAVSTISEYTKPLPEDPSYLNLTVHQGAVDRSALTSATPDDIMAQVTHTLQALGVDMVSDGDYKIKCTRRKAKRRNMVREETSRQIEQMSIMSDKRSMFVVNDCTVMYQDPPETASLRSTKSTLFPDPGSLAPSLYTFDMQPPNLDPSSASFLSIMTHLSDHGECQPYNKTDTIYGDPTIDAGEEIRFVVELCRFRNLPGIYIVDIRRLLGNVWTFKFLYHKILDLLNLGKNNYLQPKLATQQGVEMDTNQLTTEDSPSCGDTIVQQSPFFTYHQKQNSCVRPTHSKSQTIFVRS